jgi:two-component system, sensor histidine kinase and response regulator
MEQKKILIADDEPVNIQVFTSVLLKEGHLVLTAPNGIECLKIAEKETPDLILLDVQMPEMDGFETIQHLRAMKKYKYTPIVFLSGQKKTPGAIDSGYLLGSNEYWTKPIAPEELLVRVRAVLRIAAAEKKYRKLQQEFYSMIVHDLRNPISTLLGFSELLLDDKGSLNSDQIEIMEAVNRSSVKLLNIVADFLDVSQFESGEYELYRKQCPVKALLASALEKVSITKEQKEISIETDFEKGLSIFVDESYFTEVLENLLDNALRYTPASGKIFCSAKKIIAADDSGKETTVIEIRDTGSGISEEEMEALFEKNRITNVKFRKPTMRTGLGLVICREIVEAHGGTIGVESSPAKGAKFTITLPA